MGSPPLGCCLICRRELPVDDREDDQLVAHCRMADDGPWQVLCESYRAPAWLFELLEARRKLFEET